MNIPLWEDGAWTPLPPLQGDTTADACVIGLGGSGLAAILELRAMGLSVVGVDAGTVGGGAAGRNGGFLLAGIADFHHDAAAAHGRERATALYRATLDELARMAGETPADVRLTGSLRIATSAEELEDCDVQFSAMRSDDLPVERYEGPEGRGLLFPSDGTFNPLSRCRTLARMALARGARLHEQSPARLHAPGVVAVGDAKVHAGHVIVAVDGRLAELVPQLAGEVRTARLQMIGTAPVPGLSLPRPVYARYGYEYWQQLPDGRVVLGGFRDRGGDAEWTTSGEPSPLVQGELDRFLRQHLGVTAPVTHRWAAPVGYTDSGLPVVRQLDRQTWALGAYSGTGNVVGAMLGRAVARRVAGDAPVPLVALIDPRHR
jgi:gamma-glutamylputrescine oxidase